MVEAGLEPMEALVAATKNSATVCQVQQSLGTLEAGKLADVIAINGNPAQDITNLRNIDFVMKDGGIVRNSMSA